jgi:hypothetical protein
MVKQIIMNTSLSILIFIDIIRHTIITECQGGGFSNNTTKLNSDQHSEPIKVEEIYSRYIMKF